MVRRRALFLVFAATAASFATGWWAGLSAKSRPQPTAVVSAAGVAEPAITETAAPPEDPTFAQKIRPFLQKYCLDCHSEAKAAGGLSLESYTTEAAARKDRKTWVTIEHALASGEMPPKKKTQPTKDEREFTISWIEKALTKVDCSGPRDPGRVTIRRLNRAEYNNTIRDLCGVDFKPAEDFPADDVGYGFDNIGDVLSFQPILLEKYMAAADKVLDAALPVAPPITSSKQGSRPQAIQTIPKSAKTREDRPKITFTSEGSAYLEKFHFVAQGEYVIRFRAWGMKVGDDFPKADRKSVV